jgi:transcriptional regulator with XRE-family HTH domain
MLGKTAHPVGDQFGKVLRRLRKDKGLSQEALGLNAGLQRNFVSLIELGRNQPTLATVFKLADALEVKPSFLIRLTEEYLDQ